MSLPRSVTHKSAIDHNIVDIISITRIVMFILALLLSSVIIKTQAHEGYRCSHVPPTPEQVHRVWLNNYNFSANNDEPASNRQDNNSSFTIIDDVFSNRSTKNKRGVFAPTEHGIQDSIWNILRQLEKPFYSDRDELVPMKIQVHYDSSVYMLERTKLDLINQTVMPTVVKFFENALSIRREYTIDRLRISRRCPNNTIYYARDSYGRSRSYCMERCEDHAICGEIVVPKDHLLACSYCNSTSKRCTTNYSSEGRGVANAQLLLYVSAKPSPRCKRDQTIAYAAHCAQDTKTDRPVAGHANLCPQSISTDPKDLNALIATVKHELTHVLGFSVSLFAYYRDEYGRPLTDRESGPIPVDPAIGYAKWSDKVIKKIVRPGWLTGQGPIDKEVNVMVTPTVVREVRRHFNCSTLEGAELEDQGSDGTSMTHWEKRLFENEAMTGTHTQNSVYSRLTLAVLQDTGWYVANFSKADKLDWGRDLGCDFAKKSCKTWINERRARNLSIRPFCDRVKSDSLQISCTDDRSSKAVCNMKQYKEPLPDVYRNFDHLDGVSPDWVGHYGGSVDLADYCPFVQEFTWQAQNVTVRGSRCDLIGNNIDSERNAALEYYGQESRCFEHGRRWEQRSCVYKRHWHHYGAGCYKYACVNGHFDVIVGNHTYSCYYAEQKLIIEQMVDQWLYNGTIICPPCDKVCPSNKCRSYNKHLIDRVISIAEDPVISTLLDSPESTDKLRVLLDDAVNTVDTGTMRGSGGELSHAKSSSYDRVIDKKTAAATMAHGMDKETSFEDNFIEGDSRKQKKQLDYSISTASSLGSSQHADMDITQSMSKERISSSKTLPKSTQDLEPTTSKELAEVSTINPIKTKNKIKYTEYLIHLLAQHEQGPRPKQSLVCSAGLSIHIRSKTQYAFATLLAILTARFLASI